MTYRPQTFKYALPGPDGTPSGVEIELEMDDEGLVWCGGDVFWRVGENDEGDAELLALGFDLTPIEPEVVDMGLARRVKP